MSSRLSRVRALRGTPTRWVRRFTSSIGTGRIQAWGGPIQEIKAGDVVWIPPGEKHWHGAAPDTMMIHISMQEGHNGVVVEWLEHVTDEQYMGG